MSRRLENGEMIGDYRIVGFLGAGGMGSVYHGIHTKIDRPAAIKVLSNPSDGSTFKQRFFNEARVQSSLHHPNIATLYDFQESADGNDLFIVMEYVDGDTLDVLIDQRRFAVEDALLTFKSICEAVKFIHENNIVHRDIKPQNIKVSSKGAVKMLDFGIAKDAVSDGLTRVGGIVGTPNYLAPEQLFGHSASRLTDIWALGVLFYEMLTGAAPFKGSTLAELHGQISNARYEPPERENPSVSCDVTKIIDRCMCVDPRQRYQTVDAVLRDVGDALRRRRNPAADGAAPASTSIRELLSATGLVSSTTAKPRTARLSTGRIALIGSGAVFLLLTVVVFGLWAMSGPERNASANEGGNTTARRTISSKGNDLTSQRGRITTQSAPAITSQRPTARIELTEGVAEVYRDGVLIGTTPVEIEGDENETVSLTLRRPGYRDFSETIEITTRRKVFTFTLRKSL